MVGLHQVEELRNDGTDPVEVTRPVVALEHSAQRAAYRDRCAISGRIHLIDRREKRDVGPLTFEQLEIPLWIAGIGLQVFSLPELQWVDEDADDDCFVFRPSETYEGKMALVERPHCRHEPDGPARDPLRLKRFAQLDSGPRDPHESSRIATISRVVEASIRPTRVAALRMERATRT